MQVEIEVVELKNALNKILSVVDKKNSRPILTYTLFIANGQQFELISTDMEVSAKIVIPANVHSVGKFCVNGKNIFEIVKELPDGIATLSLDQTTLKLQCQDINYILVVYGSDDYPRLNFSTNENSFTLASDQILEIINRTSYAISTDETRLFFNGIFLQDVDSRLRSVATDGHRLALIESDLVDVHSEALVNGIIVPRKGIFELKKMAETDPENTINISIDESFLFANVNHRYYLSIRLIAREYPKYQAVIPSKTTYILNVDRNAFLNSVRRIKIMANEKTNQVRINLQENSMVLAANHPSFGHAAEKMNVEYSGKEIEIGFNAKYLIDTFQNLPEGEVVVEFNNEFLPFVVRSNNLSDFLGIIMPLKL